MTPGSQWLTHGTRSAVCSPALLANTRALQSGEKHWQTTIDGQPWEQPTFPYQGRCLQWLRSQHAELAAGDRDRLAEIIAGSGVEPLFGDL